MASEEIKLKITLDNGDVVDGFFQVEKQAKKSSDKIESNFQAAGTALKNGLDKAAPLFASRLSGISDTIKELLTNPFTLITLGVVATGAAIKKAFDFALAGEKLIKIENQFEILTEKSGLFADSFKAKLAGAANGLIDTSELLQLSNEAFVQLGDTANRFPEIISLALKSVKIFGGEATDAIEKLNTAIAFGSTKQLRSLGIVIDSEKVYKKYAEAINLSAGELNQAQRQQALLNAVIETGNKQFNDAAKVQAPLTLSTKQFSVQVKDLIDNLEIMAARNYGAFFAKITQGFTDFVKKANGQFTPNDKLAELADQIDKVQTRINQLSFAKFEREGKSGLDAFTQVFKDGQGATTVLEQNIRASKKQLADLNAQFKTISDAQLKAQDEIEKKALEDAKKGKKGGSVGLDAEQLRIIRAKELEAVSYTLQAEKAKIDARLATADQLKNPFEKEVALQKIFADQKVNLEADSANKIDLLRNQAQDRSILGLAKTKAQELSLTAQAELAKLQIQIRSDNERLKLATEVAANIKNILVSSTTDYVTQIGERLQKGESLFDDFGASVIGVFGDMAISIGRTLFATGLAVEAFIDAITGLFAGSGLAAAALGLGLVLFGSALKASVGKSGSSSPSSGGGTATSPSPTTELTPSQDLQRQEPATTVSIVINGDVLDSDESGSRIINLINEAFSKKGVVIQQGVIA